MDEMKELLDEATVERVIALLGLVGPLLGLAGGLLYGRLRRLELGFAAVRGLLVGLLGTLTWVMWRLFSYLVRYQPAPDPKQDYFGLERVDVLLLNMVLFIAVGVAVGLVIRSLSRPSEQNPTAPSEVAADAAAVAAGNGDVVQ